MKMCQCGAARSQGKAVEKVSVTFSTVFTQPALVSVTFYTSFPHRSRVTAPYTMFQNRYQAL